MQWFEVAGGAEVGWTTLQYHWRQKDLEESAQPYDLELENMRGQISSRSFDRSLGTGFFGFRPNVMVAVKPLPWMKLDLRGSYDYWVSPKGGMYSSEHESPIAGSPSLDIGRASVELGLTFGFFPWR
mgnify:CR=1 FL=1